MSEINEEKKEFTCEICNKTFSKNATCYTHKKHTHPNEFKPIKENERGRPIKTAVLTNFLFYLFSFAKFSHGFPLFSRHDPSPLSTPSPTPSSLLLLFILLYLPLIIYFIRLGLSTETSLRLFRTLGN